MKHFRESYYVRVLVFLLLGTLLPALLFGSAYYLVAEHMMMRSTMAEEEKNLKETAEKINGMIRCAAEAIEQLAGKEAVVSFMKSGDQRDSYACYREVMQALRIYRDHLTVHIITDASPFILSTGAVPDEYRGSENHHWGIFRQARMRPGDIVYQASSSVLSETTGTAFAMGMAVSLSEDQIGYIVFDIHRNGILALLPRYHVGEMLVTNTNGQVVFSSLGKNYEGYGKAVERLRLSVSANTQAAKARFQKDGEMYETVSRGLLGTPLAISVILPVQQITERFHQFQTFVLIGMAFLILTAPIVSVLLTRYTTAPIKRLTAQMADVEKGEFNVKLTSRRNDEIGQLEKAFVHMTQEISSLINQVTEKQKLLDQAQLKALQAQINPHFIYNTLTMIQAASKMGNTARVTETTVQLAKILRYVTDNNRDFVSLRSEIDFLNHYLSIQKGRFEQRLNYQIDIPEELMEASIPKLIIQPLVENAINHGLEGKEGPGSLLIQAKNENGYLILTVQDNGIGMTEEKLREIRQFSPDVSDGKHVGIRNVQRRVMLYGNDCCGLKIDSKPGEGSTFSIILKPLKGEKIC